MENGIPQGSVLSVTLFLISIHRIFELINESVEAIMYADDLVIMCKSKELNLIKRKLQHALNKLSS